MLAWTRDKKRFGCRNYYDWKVSCCCCEHGLLARCHNHHAHLDNQICQTLDEGEAVIGWCMKCWEQQQQVLCIHLLTFIKLVGLWQCLWDDYPIPFLSYYGPNIWLYGNWSSILPKPGTLQLLLRAPYSLLIFLILPPVMDILLCIIGGKCTWDCYVLSSYSYSWNRTYHP